MNHFTQYLKKNFSLSDEECAILEHNQETISIPKENTLSKRAGFADRLLLLKKVCSGIACTGVMRILPVL
jgi:hypothetical protein